MALVPTTLQAALLAIYDTVEAMAKAGATPEACKAFQAEQTAIAIDVYIKTGNVDITTLTIK